MVAWTAWSLYYYGFPFPNTAYAKLGAGVPFSGAQRSGERVYLLDLDKARSADARLYRRRGRGRSDILLDPRQGARRRLPVHALAFVVSIGGDFMTGRFLTAPLLVAAVVIARSVLIDTSPVGAGGGCSVFWPRSASTPRCSAVRGTATRSSTKTPGLPTSVGSIFQSYGLMPLGGFWIAFNSGTGR